MFRIKNLFSCTISLSISFLVFLTLSFVLGFSIWISLPISILVFIGLSIVTEFRDVPNFYFTDKEVLNEGYKKLRKVVLCKIKFKNSELKFKISSIVLLMKGILSHLKENPHKIHASRWLILYYFSSIHNIICKYQNLSKSNISLNEMIKTREKTITILDKFIRALNNNFSKLLNDELMDLQAEISVLDKTIKDDLDIK